MCIKSEILRARIDEELTPPESLRVDHHLAECADCYRRAEILRGRAAHVYTQLAVLAPPSDEMPMDSQAALARLQARPLMREVKAVSLFNRLFMVSPKVAWTVLAILALLVTARSFAPIPSWAGKVLDWFRVQKIEVIGIPGGFDGNPSGKLIGQLLSDQLVVTQAAGELQTVPTVEKASEMVGFTVRLPSDRTDRPQLIVVGEQALHMTIDRARWQAILEKIGRSELQVPDAWNGATVGIKIPKFVLASYGDCLNWSKPDWLAPRIGEDWSRCLALGQVPSPQINIPPHLNLLDLARISLQLMGMSATEAHIFSQSVDWTSTLVVAMPRDLASSQTVAVDGVTGTLVRLNPFNNRPAGFTLIWIKNGMVYSLIGYGNPAVGMQWAESLR